MPPGGGPGGVGTNFLETLSDLIRMGGTVFVCYVLWRALAAFEKYIHKICEK